MRPNLPANQHCHVIAPLLLARRAGVSTSCSSGRHCHLSARLNPRRSWAQPGLEGHNPIALCKEPRHVRGCHPAAVDLPEVVVVRPTGDGAALSDEHRNGMVSQLGEKLTRRRHTQALHPVGVVAQQKLCGIATQDDRGLLSHLDGTVGRQMKRDRGSSRVGRASTDEVRDLYRRSQRSGPMQQSISDRLPPRDLRHGHRICLRSAHPKQQRSANSPSRPRAAGTSGSSVSVRFPERDRGRLDPGRGSVVVHRGGFSPRRRRADHGFVDDLDAGPNRRF